MKPIFSSLGSNYTFTDSLISFQGLVQARLSQSYLSQQFSQLKVYFDSTFKGDTYFFYKGRDAIECALNAFSIGRGDGVITQAFSCFAVEEGILRTGATPVYADIADSSANLSLETVQVAFKTSAVPVKAVLVQYSLGSVPDIQKIALWCKKQKLVLIEDLAQGYGAVTEKGDPVGTIGDATIFSFGRDKILDAVTGGACCVRTYTHEQKKHVAQWYATLQVSAGQSAIIREHLYPVLTWIIRTTFSWGFSVLTLGKFLAFVGKKIGLIQSPLFVATTKASLLPHSFVPLIVYRLEHVDTQLAHREEIAQIYHKAFGGSAATLSEDELMSGSLLRYPILVRNPDTIAKMLKRKNIFISDRWYRKAVDCSTLKCNSMYTHGSAANAEKLAAHIITLPTHLNIESGDAERIIASIKAAHV